MDYTIEFNYISPLVKFKFDSKNIYMLVITHSDLKDVFIHKIIINGLDNVTDTIRGYLINRSVQVNSSILGTILNVRLYCHDIINNTIQLFGMADINLEKYEYNNKSIIYMTVPNNIHNYRITDYSDDTVFLYEYFHGVENITESSKYLLFFRLVQHNNKNIGKFTTPTIISYVDNTKINFVYNKFVLNLQRF